MEFKIASWNVNSIRARLSLVLEFLKERNPDVLCIQETKVEDKLFPKEEFEELGYKVAFKGEKRFNGIATISKHPITIEPLEFEGEKNQKRTLITKINGITIINLYFPNGQTPESEHFKYKIEFIYKLKDFLLKHYTNEKNLIILGDFNVAKEEIDVYDKDAMEGKIGFHPKEREALNELYEFGFVDLFRKFSKEKAFSWWDYRAGNFWKNIGLRIDYIWSTPELAQKCKECFIDRTYRKKKKPSDHAPVVAVFELEG
ncbi:exodeoxyribonuclease III [Hippea alviniae]|uniref:exodeoxyribonuclease III n=1 Tax=Hippea alviniae TaxID=1279027 RepID=UPI0003B797B3|nr:exodeoxyribonuclease III [Hippea alviniae]